MVFTLEPLRAQEGDCLLLHFGTAKDPKLAVIDGGPGRVYEDFLEPRLEEIREAKKKKTTWRPATDSIAALLEAKQGDGYKFRVHEVEDGVPFKIKLGKSDVPW
jgi:hypothetical protein